MRPGAARFSVWSWNVQRGFAQTGKLNMDAVAEIGQSADLLALQVCDWQGQWRAHLTHHHTGGPMQAHLPTTHWKQGTHFRVPCTFPRCSPGLNRPAPQESEAHSPLTGGRDVPGYIAAATQQHEVVYGVDPRASAPHVIRATPCAPQRPRQCRRPLTNPAVGSRSPRLFRRDFGPLQVPGAPGREPLRWGALAHCANVMRSSCAGRGSIVSAHPGFGMTAAGAARLAARPPRPNKKSILSTPARDFGPC